MLKRIQLFPLNFYEKEKFNGSMGRMNFRLAKEGDETLTGTVWEGPYCYDAAPKEEFETKEFFFSEEGIQEAIEWFEQKGKVYNSAE